MIKKISFLMFIIIFSLSLSACTNKITNTELEEFYQENFTMHVFETTFNGSTISSYPKKTFHNNELFNALNSASGKNPIKIDELKILYKISLYNGQTLTNYFIYNDGVVTMQHNLMNNNVFFLTEEQLNKVIEIIER